jgi:hypothetical protein
MLCARAKVHRDELSPGVLTQYMIATEKARLGREHQREWLLRDLAEQSRSEIRRIGITMEGGKRKAASPARPPSYQARSASAGRVLCVIGGLARFGSERRALVEALLILNQAVILFATHWDGLTLMSEENCGWHAQPHFGEGRRWAGTVRRLMQAFACDTVLDYGCGLGTLGEALGFPNLKYDPAFPGKDRPPSTADLVVCSNFLQYICPSQVDSVLKDLACLSQKALLVYIEIWRSITHSPVTMTGMRRVGLTLLRVSYLSNISLFRSMRSMRTRQPVLQRPFDHVRVKHQAAQILGGQRCLYVI